MKCLTALVNAKMSFYKIIGPANYSLSYCCALTSTLSGQNVLPLLVIY